MDNVATHLQRLQLGAGPPRRRRARPSADNTAAPSPSDPHACMRRLLAGAFRSSDGAAFQRQNPTTHGATPVFQVAFARATGLQSRAQRLLAAVDEDGVVSLIDTAAAAPTPSDGVLRRVHHQWEAHENAIFDLAWAHDNTFLLTASGDLRATAWDVETQLARFSLAGGHSMSVKCVRQSADQLDTIATGARDGHVLVWDARAPAKPVAQLRGVHSAPAPSPPLSSASPSVHFLSPPSARKRRKPNATASPAAASSSATPRSVTSVEFLGGGHEIATAGAVDGVVKIWDLRRLTAPRKIPLHGSVNSASSPLRAFACGSNSPRARAQRGITSLALDPGTRARLLVSVLHDELCVLDVHARDPHRAVALRLEGHAASSFYVKAAFSPDGDFVVSGSGDGAVYLWDARGSSSNVRAPQLALKAHEGEVNGVAWHASDFGTLATCSDDGTVRVWHADRQVDKELAEFKLRRRGHVWQNWGAWGAQDGGRAYAIEALDGEQEADEEAPAKQLSPPVVHRNADALTTVVNPKEPDPPLTPVATRVPAVPVGSAQQKKRRAAPATLLDFWGK